MSFTPVAQRVMNEFDWSNIAVMIKKKHFQQINSDRLLEEFKKFFSLSSLTEIKMEICIPRAFLWTKCGIYLCS